jgi:hypothetical protein
LGLGGWGHVSTCVAVYMLVSCPRQACGFISAGDRLARFPAGGLTTQDSSCMCACFAFAFDQKHVCKHNLDTRPKLPTPPPPGVCPNRARIRNRRENETRFRKTSLPKPRTFFCSFFSPHSPLPIALRQRTRMLRKSASLARRPEYLRGVALLCFPEGLRAEAGRRGGRAWEDG